MTRYVHAYVEYCVGDTMIVKRREDTDSPCTDQHASDTLVSKQLEAVADQLELPHEVQ